ncbi:hypothetical protein BDQ17DRAFT_573480 [Cyathus striatus]|nr:hypothetical protein BDQ17DRAFT_573480 [Cyathus striatus]
MPILRSPPRCPIAKHTVHRCALPIIFDRVQVRQSPRDALQCGGLADWSLLVSWACCFRGHFWVVAATYKLMIVLVPNTATSATTATRTTRSLPVSILTASTAAPAPSVTSDGELSPLAPLGSEPIRIVLPLPLYTHLPLSQCVSTYYSRRHHIPLHYYGTFAFLL